MTLNPAGGASRDFTPPCIIIIIITAENCFLDLRLKNSAKIKANALLGLPNRRTGQNLKELVKKMTS